MESAVFLLSAAVLMYQIVLMRLLTITQWHHVASMVISIALLGFGASGTFLAIFRTRLRPHWPRYYRLCAVLFALAVFASYYASQHNQFNPFELLWNPRQYLYLLEYYLVLFIPFFFAATAIGLALTENAVHIGHVYASNLSGSGVGALVAIAAGYSLHPIMLLYGVAGLGGCSAVFDCKGSSARKTDATLRTWTSVVLLLGLSAFGMRADPLHLRAALNISQYKSLSLTRNLPSARILTETVSPLGVVNTVSSPMIRHAPGLSLRYTGTLPEQIAIFVDAEQAGVITQFTGEIRSLTFLDFLTAAWPYHLRSSASVLVLGAGGGMDVLNAVGHNARTIDAVELNPQVIQLLRTRFRDFSGALYDLPHIRVMSQEARGYAETTAAVYDVIQIALLDAFGTSSAGVHGLNESYLYTVEALQKYYARLAPDGLLVITRWVKFPPRDELKLFATAIDALAAANVTDIPQHLAAIRSWATWTMVVSKAPLTADDIERTRVFCRERAFDLCYLPGILPQDANRYHQLPTDEYYRAAQTMLFGDSAAFYTSYPYAICPAHDHTPYFFNFFKWTSLLVFWRTMRQQWIPFIEWNYPLLLATLIQAGFASLILILLPLRWASPSAAPRGMRGVVLIYFTSLGISYLALEMMFMQQFMLFLAHPVYTAGVVIATLLIFSGMGSAYVAAHQQSITARHIVIAALGIAGGAVAYNLALPYLFAVCAAWPTGMKIGVTISLIAPIAFGMGFPFPYGLRQVHDHADSLMPWAYGVNGCASVLSALLATVIAIPFGFRAVLALAGGLYLLAAGVAYRCFR